MKKTSSIITRKTIVSVATAVALIGLSTPAFAQQPDTHQAVYFTFSAPVTLPGVTLPAGRYEFKLATSAANLNIVQIYAGDGSKMFATLQTNPAIRSDIPDNAQVSFLETPAGAPRAIQTWWYPGTKSGGHEFIYSRQQAQQLVQAGVKGVLTTHGDNNSGSLVRLSPSGEDTNFGSTSATGQMQAADAGHSNAPMMTNPDSAMAARTSATKPAAVPSDTMASNNARTALPRTASAQPLVALGGMAFLLAGFTLVWTRRRVNA